MRKLEDSELRRRVLEELDWEPIVDSSTVGVAVRNGVVTLTGSVSNDLQKTRAERAVRQIYGVKAIANDLSIDLADDSKRSDTDIAHSALAALRLNVSVPADRIQVIVDRGCVTLDGEVDWQDQRLAAEDDLKHLPGVRSIVNNIAIKPQIIAANAKD